MTEREEARAQQRLMGRYPAMEWLIIISMLIMITIVGGALAIFYLLLGSMMETDPGVASVSVRTDPLMMGMVVVCAILILLLLLLLVDHFRMAGGLREKYERIPESKKRELIRIASNYQVKNGICSQENYVYGMMSKSIHGSRNFHHMLSFQYLQYFELLWVYEMTTSIAMTNQYGAAPSVMQDHRQDRVRIYDIYGNIYDVLVKKGDSHQVMMDIKEKNSKCRLGYSKEGNQWLKEQMILK